MKRFGLCMALLFVLGWTQVHAGSGVGLGLYVNHASIAGSITGDMKTTHGFMAFGGEGIYKDDQYRMVSGFIGVKNDELTPGVNFLVGFKGFFIDAEDKRTGGDDKASGLAFLLGMGYELDARLNPLPIPVSLDAQFSGSPKPLTWQEGEYYWEARGGLGFHVLNNAAIRLDLRRISVSFEEENQNRNWSKDDYNILLGYEIRF